MAKKISITHRLYTGEISYDFIKNRRIWYTFTGVILLICVISVSVFGLKWGIEFIGGTEFGAPTTVTSETVDEYRQAVLEVGLPDMQDLQVTTLSAEVRVQTRPLDVETDEVTKIRAAIAAKAGIEPAQVTYQTVGASWGAQITQTGLIALVVFLVLVGLLISIYFRDFKMAVAAILALMHDLVVTIGLYALARFSVTPATLIGMLTILGYSLYDTVVVFDKVRENVTDLENSSETYSSQANKAVNQVLVRSINTTIIGVLPVAALTFAGTFILGTGPLKDLGLALLIGMIAGTYSSIFIATPLLAQMRELEPRMVEHRKRLERRAAKHSWKQKPVEDEAGPASALSVEVTEVPDGEETVTTLGVMSSERLERVRHQPAHASRSQRKKN
ncbi:MAG: protein translocase subunit SecF [Propionibacteriaceae bacterium]|jgi:preprotein translocase subunit SecF|nr:protein translocase subunit SecF [Propionibacteriaceae bacterium]